MLFWFRRNPEKNYLYRINTHTWQVELINLGASHALFADKTASSFDGTVYAVYNNNLLTFDYTTYTSHSFGTTNRNYIALGVSGLNELYGIADDGKLVRINTQTGAETVSEIRAKTGMESNEFSKYRLRLIRKGLVDGSERGRLAFTLPLFREFVLNQLEYL